MNERVTSHDGADESVPREILDYETFGSAVRELATQVAESDFEPDWILSITRGGLLIGAALGYALGIKNLASINVEFYSGIGERLPEPIVLPPSVDLEELAGANILIADDVADTGETLKLVQQRCATVAKATAVAVLYQKPESCVDCEFVWRHTDRWINFPWSSLPIVRRPG